MDGATGETPARYVLLALAVLYRARCDLAPGEELRALFEPGVCEFWCAAAEIDLDFLELRIVREQGARRKYYYAGARG